MLKSTTIRRFKSLPEVTVTWAPMNILVGANNSGKSSVLQAIHFGTSLAQTRRILLKQPVAYNHQAFSVSAQQLLYTPVEDVMTLGLGGSLSQDRFKSIEIEHEHVDGRIAQLNVRRGKNRNLYVNLTGKALLTEIEDLERPFSIYVPGLAGLARDEVLIGEGALRRAVARGDSNLVLRNVLYRLSRVTVQGAKTPFNQFINWLTRVFPGSSITISFDERTNESIDVLATSGGKALVPLESSGTGFLQTVQILSYLAFFQPRIVLLDEPDSHLHPSNQRQLTNLLAELADEGVAQFLLATHSRHVLDAARETSQVSWINAGGIALEPPELDVLIGLGALDSAEGLAAGKVSYVLLSEDADTRPIRSVLKAKTKKEVMVWPYKGCSKLDVAQTLSSFIHRISPKTKVVIHRDGDYLLDEDKEWLRNRYAQSGLEMWITPGVDLEALFTDEVHLKELNQGHDKILEETLNEIQKQLSGELKAKAQAGGGEVEKLRFTYGRPTAGKEALGKWIESTDFLSMRWRHGKLFLAALRAAFKAKTGKNLIDVRESTRLVELVGNFPIT